MMTAEQVVRRIAAECAYVDERGGVGIRLKPAVAIVREYGEQFSAPRVLAKPAMPGRRSRRKLPKEPTLL